MTEAEFGALLDAPVPTIEEARANPEVYFGRVLRFVLLDRSIWCVLCGEKVPPGTPILALAGDPAPLAHDGRSPGWTPRLIHGGLSKPTQLTLPLLAAVPEEAP